MKKHLHFLFLIQDTENAFMYGLIKFYTRTAVSKALTNAYYYGKDLLKVS